MEGEALDGVAALYGGGCWRGVDIIPVAPPPPVATVAANAWWVNTGAVPFLMTAQCSPTLPVARC